jgi:hypothetical protein
MVGIKWNLKVFEYLSSIIGRCDRIRTYDPFTPSEVRYQAAPHTDRATYYMDILLNIYRFLIKFYC